MLPLHVVVLADWDRLVFRSRNRTYGAYALRRHSGPDTLRALALVVGWVTTACIWFKEQYHVPPRERAVQSTLIFREPTDFGPLENQAVRTLTPSRWRTTYIKAIQVVEDSSGEESIGVIYKISAQLPVPREWEEDTVQIEDDICRLPPNYQPLYPPEFEVDTLRPPPQVIACGFSDYSAPKLVNLDALQSALGYPPGPLGTCVEGVVVVRILVSETGHYIRHRVLRSPHPSLTQAVEAHLQMLRFTPGIQAGKPIRVWVNIPVRFRLRN